MTNITCEYIRVISKYIKSLLEVLSIAFNDTINTSETKCLNTAIMIVVVLIGSEHFSTLDECSVNNTVKNMNTKITTNYNVITKLKRDMNKSDSGMFYILITDGMLTKGSNSEQVYFPGHVFIIDKNKDCFSLYQSYINEYSLDKYLEREDCNCMDKKQINRYIKNIQKLLTTPTQWEANTASFWKSMTNVDSEQFIGCNFDNIYICFKKFKHQRTIDKTLSFIETTLQKDEYRDNKNIQTSFSKMAEELKTVAGGIKD
jgi:hypothetical protein